VNFMKRWWEGKYFPEPKGSPFVTGTYKRHWTSKVAHLLADFYLNHWKWLWGATITVIGLVMKFMGAI
jgi:hypothetical protein